MGGNSHSLLTPENQARMVADGRKYMTHAQAIVDSFPSSMMSDADKEYCFKWLEEHPFVAGTMLHDSFRPYEVEMFKDMVAGCPLHDFNRPHHYRGYAERIPPDTPPVPAVTVADEAESEAAAASTCDSSSAHSSRRDGPADPELLACESSSFASSSSLSPRAAEPEADCALDEERVSLLAKKRQ